MGNCNQEHQHTAACDHSNDDPNRGSEFSLYTQIDFEGIRCFNALDPANAKTIFRCWDDRFETVNSLESDADEQIILFIPFISNIKLKSILLLGQPGESNPKLLKVFINREDVDFDSVDSIEPLQEWNLIEHPPRNIIPEYPTKLTKFASVRNITLFFDSNFGAVTTMIHYLGFKGEWTAVHRDPIITVYELAANPADHKQKSGQESFRSAIQ
jgi:hypothetical protein